MHALNRYISKSCVGQPDQETWERQSFSESVCDGTASTMEWFAECPTVQDPTV